MRAGLLSDIALGLDVLQRSDADAVAVHQVDVAEGPPVFGGLELCGGKADRKRKSSSPPSRSASLRGSQRISGCQWTSAPFLPLVTNDGWRARQAHDRLALGPAWQDNDLVFPDPIGGPMEGRFVLRHYFRPLLKKAAVPPIRFHDLRYTTATLMLSQGVHPKVVSEMLGHTTIGITLDINSHVLPEMQREAANTLDQLLTDADEGKAADNRE
jgi:hypothetical protein